MAVAVVPDGVGYAFEGMGWAIYGMVLGGSDDGECEPVLCDPPRCMTLSYVCLMLK